jgi:hypothetical protein
MNYELWIEEIRLSAKHPTGAAPCMGPGSPPPLALRDAPTMVGHVGGDNGYGCVDQSIIEIRFFIA